jgi:hypothetical protein
MQKGRLLRMAEPQERKNLGLPITARWKKTYHTQPLMRNLKKHHC